MMQWVLIVSIKIHLDLPTCGKCSKGIFRSYRVGYFYVQGFFCTRAYRVNPRPRSQKCSKRKRPNANATKDKLQARPAKRPLELKTEHVNDLWILGMHHSMVLYDMIGSINPGF